MSVSAAGISGSSASNAAGMSSPGIGSGLDVNTIVSKLMAVEGQPILLLNNKVSSYQTQLSAYGQLNSALSSFQNALGGLTSAAKFQALTATPTDTTVLTASATAGATAGNYALNVTQLAQAQTITATGQASTTAPIGTGAATTLSFSFGTITGTATAGVYGAGTTFAQDSSQATKTVTIDSSNNTLQGIRDAINAANIGVSATIVNDGSATPYRLQLTSSTGQNKSMEIAVSGDATLASLLNYNVTAGAGAGQNMTQNMAAQNATLSVNGLSVTSSSNTVTNAASGVTLNLAKIGTTNLSIANDTSSIQAAIQSFVSAYNGINTSIGQLTAYDPSTKQGGPLVGDYTTMLIQNKLRSVLSSPITGLGNATITTLSQLGVSFQKDGSLALDTTKLQTAMSTNLKDIAGMFAAVGQTTDSLVSYVSSGTNTQVGSYAVNVTTLATQGNAVGNANLNAGITINASNNTLGLTLDGVASQVTLTAGTYTSAQLAALVQSAINGNSAFSSVGSSAAVSVNPTTGFMTITSNKYGSASNVSIVNSSAGTALMGGATSTAGVDVAGTINGLAASGLGQYLTGAAGSAVDGLKLQINGGAIGARGTINYSQGYATALNNAVASMMGTSGILSSATNGINKSIQDLNNQITAQNQRLTTVEANYRAQFTALDVMMSQMQTTTSFLTQQLSAMSSSLKTG